MKLHPRVDTRTLYAALDAAASAAEDLPDGAWQQMIMDAVTTYNKTQGATKVDPYDGFIWYCEQRIERR